MRKITIVSIVFLMLASLMQTFIYAQADKDLYQEAKVLIFDKEWKRAQSKLEELIEKYPDSRYYSQALYYKGKCLAEQSGREAQALEAFKTYIRHEDADENLVDDAESSIIDLSLRLYDRGKRSYLREIERRLESTNRAIRYYAAYRLSFVKDKRAGEKAIPVLEEMLETQKDEELRDRARLAILRIDPNALKEHEETREESSAKILCIRVFKEYSDEPTFSLNIPWALADLAFQAIPAEEKASLRREGYDIDSIVEQLQALRGDILEIWDEKEGVRIKIWIK